jgi:hypothetical protein
MILELTILARSDRRADSRKITRTSHGTLEGEWEVHLEEKEAYTVAEVSVLTGFSSQTVTRLFERESGVIILERPERMHKRRYRSIRIPRHVYQRVIRKITT